jgi:Na+/H+ antiporter NhaC
VATTNNTISIIAVGPIAKNIGDQFGIDRRRIASILDIFSSAFNGLLPYAGQLLVAGAMAKISPTAIMPYVWYCILMLIFGIIFIFIGFPKRYVTNN